jgi:ribosome-binding protein aMBF1 (putative translation factor)
MSTKLVYIDKIGYDVLYGLMSPEQSRAARGWLGWSQQDLAKRAKVGVSTIKSFENGDRKPIANNLGAIQRAFEATGVELLFDGGGRAQGIKVAQ